MTQRINFQKITEISARCYDQDSVADVAGENKTDAIEVLRNWSAAASWGLPRSLVAEILSEEADRLYKAKQ